MPGTYDIGSITPDKIDAAYVLARIANPSLSLLDWRQDCRRTLQGSDEQANIFVAINPLGYIQGLCTISGLAGRDRDRVLDVSAFVVASAADAPGVADDLLQFLKQRARASGCGNVRIRSTGGYLWQSGGRDATSEAAVLIIPAAAS